MKKLELNFDKLKCDYDANYQKYLDLCNALEVQLLELFKDNKVILAVPCESRVKEWDSIVEKCERNHLQIEQISNISDLAGLRYIVLFQSDTVKACNIINENFTVLGYENVQERLSENEFGYGSIHFDVITPSNWSIVPTLKKLQGLQAEIQIRTISQHTWAACSHILQYKRESDVPKPLIRSMNRVAALLEVVDFEFERLLHERKHYLQDIEKNQSLLKDEILNVDTLQLVLDNYLPIENKKEYETYSELIDTLAYFGISKIDDLKNLLLKHIDKLIKIESVALKNQIHRYENGQMSNDTEIARLKSGVFFSHVGLVRTALREEFGTQEVEKYFDNKRNRKNNNRITPL